MSSHYVHATTDKNILLMSLMKLVESPRGGHEICNLGNNATLGTRGQPYWTRGSKEMTTPFYSFSALPALILTQSRRGSVQTVSDWMIIVESKVTTAASQIGRAHV